MHSYTAQEIFYLFNLFHLCLSTKDVNPIRGENFITLLTLLPPVPRKVPSTEQIYIKY